MSNTIVINGRVIKTSGNNSSVTINNGEVWINGRRISDKPDFGQKIELTINAPVERVQIQDDAEVEIKVSGRIANLEVQNSIVVNGNIAGNVKAGGSVNCGSIDGNAEVGGSVNCGNIGGDVRAGGSVNRR